MKALVFAAGLGTRLKPFTLYHPKALVEVNGTPMLELVISKLISAGINEIVVNVHHFADQIRDFLKSRNNFGIDIQISDETNLLLETGGGILQARKLLEGDEPFIVHNADILTDFPLQEMIASHRSSKADATLLVAPRRTSRYLYFDKHTHLLTGWENISTQQTLPHGFTPSADLQPLAFGGVHILSSSIFNRLENFSTDPKFSIIPFYVENCNSLKIMSYQPTAAYNWLDIGKPESLAEAEKIYAKMQKQT